MMHFFANILSFSQDIHGTSVAEWLARFLGEREIAGSIPGEPTDLLWFFTHSPVLVPPCARISYSFKNP